MSNRGRNVALLAVEYLAFNRDDMSAFIAESGIDIGDIGKIALSDEFLSAVVTFIAHDRHRLEKFSCDYNVAPQEVVNSIMAFNNNYEHQS